MGRQRPSRNQGGQNCQQGGLIRCAEPPSRLQISQCGMFIPTIASYQAALYRQQAAQQEFASPCPFVRTGLELTFELSASLCEPLMAQCAALSGWIALRAGVSFAGSSTGLRLSPML